MDEVKTIQINADLHARLKLLAVRKRQRLRAMVERFLTVAVERLERAEARS